MNSLNVNNIFNKDYFEDGVKKGISGYEKYSWMPTRSIPEAISIINTIKFENALDFGCAKGFLVHALNLLDKKTIGVDISKYAIDNCLPQVKDKVFLIKENVLEKKFKTDLLIAKDVLEHINEHNIDEVLSNFYNICNQALLVIPLGDNDTFRIKEYEIDKTHMIKKDEEWWIQKIKKANFKLKYFNYNIGNIKEKWLSINKYGNGFFILNK